MTPELVTEIIRLARIAPDMYALGLSGEDAGAWVYSFFRLRRQDMAMQRAMHYYRFGFSDGGHPRFFAIRTWRSTGCAESIRRFLIGRPVAGQRPCLMLCVIWRDYVRSLGYYAADCRAFRGKRSRTWSAGTTRITRTLPTSASGHSSRLTSRAACMPSSGWIRRGRRWSGGSGLTRMPLHWRIR